MLAALYYENTFFSEKEQNLAIDKICRILIKEGVTKKDRVALQPGLDPASIFCFFALLKIGASPCLLSHRLPSESLFAHVQRARCAFFLNPQTLCLEKLQDPGIFTSHIALFTSGSSGFAKLVCLTQENFSHSALGSLERLQLTPSSYYLLSVPLFHVSGLSILFRAAYSKSTLIIEPLISLSISKATHCSVVPTQLFRLLEQKAQQRFPHLRSLLVGGAPLPQTLLQKALQKGFSIQTTYGMTETASQITLSKPQESLIPLHQGSPLAGRKIRIADDGQILVQGPVLFSGYDLGETIDRPLTSDGWFATGDLGLINNEGNLEYLGRKDHMFISGGENIYPEEIERHLGSLEDVYEAIVIGVPDPEYGKRPVAFLQMKGPIPPAQELAEKLSLKIPKFCIPICFLPLPPSQTLKRKRQDLEQLACLQCKKG